MTSAFEIIGNAWNFYRKQPVLNQIAFWLFFFPIGALDALSGLVDTVAAQGLKIDANTLQSINAMEMTIMIPVVIALIYFMVWGHVCTLMVSKRLLSSSAGRTRSSFKAVRDQSKKFIIPLFLLSILRSITTLLWAIPLIVPGVIYSLRTVFYDIMMIEGGKVLYGRATLEQSAELVKGRSWDVLWRLLIISACIFLPASLINMGLQLGLTTIDARLEDLAIILVDAIDAYTGMFFIVCTVALYAEVKKTSTTK